MFVYFRLFHGLFRAILSAFRLKRPDFLLTKLVAQVYICIGQIAYCMVQITGHCIQNKPPKN